MRFTLNGLALTRQNGGFMATLNRDQVKALVSELAVEFPGIEVVDKISLGVQRLSIGLATEKVKPSCLVLVAGDQEGLSDQFVAKVNEALKEQGHGDLTASLGSAN